MKGLVRFQMHVRVEVRQEGQWFYSSCPMLDVHSQGHSREEAVNNLVEALQLFVETCFELGTLNEVLSASGLRPSHEDVSEDDADYVDVPLSLVAQNHAEARAN